MRGSVAHGLGGMLLFLSVAASAQETSLQLFGHGVDMIDRVKIRIDDPALPSDPGPSVDVGTTDFTIEFFMRADADDNTQGGSVTCNAANIDWIYGNILLDRDRFNQDRKYGLSFADSGALEGVVVFGVSGDGTGDRTLCSTTNVLDDAWHHVAVQRRRSDGRLWLYVDGILEGEVDGPDGDISYPNDGVPGPYCGGPCNDSDPFLVIGAEKHDAGSSFPSYAGRIDELRVSTTLRYTTPSFPVPGLPFTTDADTAALYAFDATPGSCTGFVADTSGAAGGPSDGTCEFGGSGTPGPVYSADTPFPGAVPALPLAGAVGLGLALGAVAWRGPRGSRRRPGASTAPGPRRP